MHLSFKNICFNHLIPCMVSKKMGENGEIVRFLGYFMVFRKRTYGELMGGLGTSLIFL